MYISFRLSLLLLHASCIRLALSAVRCALQSCSPKVRIRELTMARIHGIHAAEFLIKWQHSYWYLYPSAQ